MENTTEETIISYKALKWLPVVQVVTLVLGICLSFSVALTRGTVNLYLPFISETGAFSPESCIFSLFLILGSVLGLFLVLSRYILFNHSEDRKSAILNKTSTIFGIFAMLGLGGVAAFPMSTVFIVHLGFAGLYFACSLGFCISSTALHFKIKSYSTVFKLKLTLSVVLLLLLVILLICFPIALKTWHEYNHILPALKDPSHKGFGLILFSSVLEWSCAILISSFNLTLYSDTERNSLSIAVKNFKKVDVSDEQVLGSLPTNSQVAENGGSCPENGDGSLTEEKKIP